MNYRKAIALALLISIVTTFALGRTVQEQRHLQQSMIKNQKFQDRERRASLLRKVRGFMGEINGRLEDGSSTHMDIPIDMDRATDVEEIEHIHTDGTIPPKIFVYGRTSAMLRAEPQKSASPVGKIGTGERVQVLQEAHQWILIRKKNGHEGWLPGTLLSAKKTAPSSGKTVSPGDTGKIRFRVPTKGTVTSPFGYRVHPVTKKRRAFHRGIDIGAPTGTPVRAAAEGVVIRSTYNRNGYGNLIVIKHEKNLCTYYGHLSKRRVRKGQRVRKGDLIGNVGSTGASTGPHLHFEVRRGSRAVNPNAFLL